MGPTLMPFGSKLDHFLKQLIHYVSMATNKRGQPCIDSLKHSRYKFSFSGVILSGHPFHLVPSPPDGQLVGGEDFTYHTRTHSTTIT